MKAVSHRSRRSRICIVLMSLLAIMPMALLSDAAIASGGGGGGGGSSAPKRDPQPFYQSGLENLKNKRYDAAQKDFSQVLGIVPDNPQANLFMGMAQEGQQNFKGAGRSYKKASKDRELYEARARLGIIELKLGERGDAEKELGLLEKAGAGCAGKCTPDQLAKLQAAIDMLKAALAAPAGKTSSLSAPVIEQATASKEQSQQQYLAAVSLINSAQYELAIATLRDELMAAGPSADVLNYLGFANRKLKHYAEAESYYRQALAIEPLHRGANEYLGELYIEQGRRDLAIAQLAKLQQLCSFGCIEEEELRRWLSIASR